MVLQIHHDAWVVPGFTDVPSVLTASIHKMQCILEAMCVTVDFWYSAHYSGFCIKLLSILGQIKAPGLLGETLPWKDDPLSAL